jgi:hypothetical protein
MPGMAQPLPREIKKNAGYSAFCDKINKSKKTEILPKKVDSLHKILFFFYISGNNFFNGFPEGASVDGAKVAVRTAANGS